MSGDDRATRQTPTVRRILAVIEQSRPAAIAGWPAFWARLTDLSEEEATAGLETLVGRGVVRRQALGDRVLYITDPPHAAQPPHP